MARARVSDDLTFGDYATAIVDGKRIEGRRGWLNITGVDNIKVEIAPDGSTLWLHAPDCKLKISGIRGHIRLLDKRPRIKRWFSGAHHNLEQKPIPRVTTALAGRGRRSFL